MPRKPLVVVEEEEELPNELDVADLEMYDVVPEAPYIKALIYSEPGGGKTTLASTAQDHNHMAPVLFGNVEGGLISIAHRRDIKAVDIRSTEDLYTMYRKLANGDFGDIGTVVIDNITELQTLNLDEIVAREVASSKNDREDYDFIDQGDYGTSTTQIGRIIRWFKGLEVNLIITAHAKFVYPTSRNTRSGVNVNVEPVAVVPMLSQKLMKTVMGMVDYVWFLQFDPETQKRLMLTRPDGIYQAKTRGPHFAEALGAVVENPTMPRLYDLLVKSESQPKKRGK